MQILITGGAGFVGSNLALALREQMPDVDVTAMDNLYRSGSELNVTRLEAAGVRFHKGDVRHPDSFPTEPFDLMIEPSVLAGQDGSPDYLFQTNLVGAYHCLEACRRHGAGIIFLSTSRIYPIARLEGHPWREEETRFTWADEGTPGISSRGVTESLALDGPRSLYGFTKLAAEQLIEEYRATYGLKAVVNRCGVIAGPWQFGKVDQGVAALWVMAHHYQRKLSYIGYGGTGKQVRDMLHIHDLCDLLIEQVRHFDAWDGWLGNVAGGLDCSASLQELTALCQEITGNTIDITSIPETRPNDLRIFVADCTKLEAKLAEIRGQGRKEESGNEKAEMGRRRNQGTGDRGHEAEFSSSVSAFRFQISDFPPARFAPSSPTRTNGSEKTKRPCNPSGRDRSAGRSHFTFFRRRLFFLFSSTPHAPGDKWARHGGHALP